LSSSIRFAINRPKVIAPSTGYSWHLPKRKKGDREVFLSCSTGLTNEVKNRLNFGTEKMGRKSGFRGISAAAIA
jgi:hypothetical protein